MGPALKASVSDQIFCHFCSIFSGSYLSIGKIIALKARKYYLERMYFIMLDFFANVCYNEIIGLGIWALGLACHGKG